MAFKMWKLIALDFSFRKSESAHYAGIYFRTQCILHILVALHFKYDFWHMTATAGSDVVPSGRPIFDDIFQHLWPFVIILLFAMFFYDAKDLQMARKATRNNKKTRFIRTHLQLNIRKDAEFNKLPSRVTITQGGCKNLCIKT
ncbi:UNVERIFIED_CONTAM: Histone H2A- orphon [Trichonephila clavipes]